VVSKQHHRPRKMHNEPCLLNGLDREYHLNVVLLIVPFSNSKAFLVYKCWPAVKI